MTNLHADSMKHIVRQNMEARETEDLLAIWMANRRSDWTEEAFEVVHDILLERLGEVPPQPERVLENPQDLDSLSQEEEMWFEQEYQWEQRKMLFRLANWARGLAWVVLIWPIARPFLNFLFPAGAAGALGGSGESSFSAILRGSIDFLILYAIRYILFFTAAFLERLRADQPDEIPGGSPDAGREEAAAKENHWQKALDQLAFWAGILSIFILPVFLVRMGLDIIQWIIMLQSDFYSYDPVVRIPIKLAETLIEKAVTGGMVFFLLLAIRYGLLALSDLFDLIPTFDFD